MKLFVISENCVKLCLKVFVALLELGPEWILYQTIKTIDVIKVQDVWELQIFLYMHFQRLMANEAGIIF